MKKPERKKGWRRMLLNPIAVYRERRAMQNFELEKRLMRREETMNQDLERFLMELEERHTWIAYELNARNLDRLRREAAVEEVLKKEAEKAAAEEKIRSQENGLTFFRGNIVSEKRWQNHAAKHLDFQGHTAPVFACKMSKCLNYVLSCSADKTIRLWQVKTGRVLMIYNGHTKKVNDCDFHPTFRLNDGRPIIISASNDCTIRYWNTHVERHMRIIQGHNESVYRVQFSPDGNRFVSCSEDLTIRTWCFPDAFVLYIYRAHTAPVTTVSFSPTGRFLISASDYGERKILLWDATMPKIEQARVFPHMLFWTPDGLIKKILIRQGQPADEFWLAKDQMEILEENAQVEMWDGELAPDEELDSDSESDSEAEKKSDASSDFGKDDMRVYKRVSVKVIATDNDGKHTDAVEYVPGGSLTIMLQVGFPLASYYFWVSLFCSLLVIVRSLARSLAVEPCDVTFFLIPLRLLVHPLWRHTSASASRRPITICFRRYRESYSANSS
jgi:hypothetical protein